MRAQACLIEENAESSHQCTAGNVAYNFRKMRLGDFDKVQLQNHANPYGTEKIRESAAEHKAEAGTGNPAEII